MTVDLRELIESGRVHVMDGAMGTVLYSRGVFVNVCYDQLNINQPDLVQEVHEAYVGAGAEIIETNTFGGNPVKLSAYGLDDQTEEINHAAVKLARKAANGRAAVVGAVGPLGIRIEPWGPTARDEATAHFGRQIAGLLAGGVDGFILETFSDIEELQAAVRAARSQSDLPIMAQMTVGVDGNTSYGAPVETIASSLSSDDVSVLGINCSVGPASMLDAVERLAEATRLPVSAQPNAGMPRAVGDRKIYLASPEYVAQYAKRMIDAGARFVGGCCGTTPDHIKHIRGYVQSVQPRNSAGAVIIPVAGDVVELQAVPLDERSNLGRKLAGGEFVCTVELTPPRGWQADAIVRDAAALKNAGIDAVSVVDIARAQSRMGAQAAALIVEREAGIETILHYTCRDRNMLGMVSDLLGAAASGLRNLLLVTGDPPAMGPYPDSTAVFDIDSIGLTNVVHRLNQGLDPGGGNIGKPTRYVTGVAFNPGAVDMQRELERFAWKVEAGAEFAVTQPVFDSAQLGALLQHTKGVTIPVIAGIWPLISVRDAEFLANEVPGVHVPQAVIERMARAQERGSDVARAEGQRIALEIFQEIADEVQGVHVSTPGGDAAVALEFVERAMPRARS